MMTLAARLRIIVGALSLFALATISCPVAAQQPNSVDPMANAVKEQQLLQEHDVIRGRGSIPDVRSYTIEQTAGREWRYFHEVTLRWIGAVAILGVLALLIVFYLSRGMIRIESGRSGHTIVRFNMFERLVHWMTATCFIILALSGLNITFGKSLLLPLLGPEAISTWSEMAKYAHNAAGTEIGDAVWNDHQLDDKRRASVVGLLANPEALARRGPKAGNGDERS